MSDCKGNSVFGNVNPDGIRFYQNSLIASEGANMVQKMMLDGIFAPYEQLLRGRITLKAGQCKYLLNHLGLGDNATFLTIVANYDTKSKIDSQNFVQYSYYSDPNHWHSFAQMILLTGNSENRIEQLYLTNPNQNQSVVLDIMVGVIDDESGFFNDLCDIDDTAVSSVITFKNLKSDDIITWIAEETIAVLNPAGVAQAYINIADINSIEKTGNIITINDRSVGTIILEFVDDYQSKQALSILSWILEDPTRITQNIDPVKDDIGACIIFTPNVYIDGAPSPTSSVFVPGATSSNWNDCPVEAETITNPTYVPVAGDLLSTKSGNLFEVLPLLLTDYNNAISRSVVGNHIIDCVMDHRDGHIAIDETNVIITDASGNIYYFIIDEGDYIIKFDINDIAENPVNPLLQVKITITT